jgi:hypothetical protein
MVVMLEHLLPLLRQVMLRNRRDMLHGLGRTRATFYSLDMIRRGRIYSC